VFLGAGYGMWTRTSDFAASWPKYAETLHSAAATVETKIAGGIEQIAPQPSDGKPADPAPETGILRNLILRGIGSLYALFLEITFVPCLVCLMLAGKRDLWHGTLQLFPAARRTAVKETLEDLRDVLRDYLAGMTIVTILVIAASSLFFWIAGLDYPGLLGIASGLLNMVPYIGAVLAWL